MNFVFSILLILIFYSKSYASDDLQLSKYIQSSADKTLINIGADWCLPCRFYKRKIFNSENFKEYLVKQDVNYVELEYGSPDARLIMKHFNQVGVPFYVYMSHNNIIEVKKEADWRFMLENIKKVIESRN